MSTHANTVTVAAPGTVANMVCGFDIIGFSLEAPCDYMTLALLDEPVLRISATDAYPLPTSPADNVAGGALLALMAGYQKLHGGQIGFAVHIDKRIKPGSGIGSSAASAAGAVVAANHLLGGVFSKLALVDFAMDGEVLASGAKHADNVAPCIFGGCTLVRSTFPLDVVPLATPPLHVSVVHPQIEIRTADARAILPMQVPLQAAIQQWGHVAGLVAGLAQADYALIGRSLQDFIVEPVRSKLIPGFDEVKQRSLAAGALGGGISGSGPSIFMLSKDAATAQAVEQEMGAIYARLGHAAHTYATTLSPHGVRVVC